MFKNAMLLSGGATSAIEPWDESGFTLTFAKDLDGVWIELIGKRCKSKGTRVLNLVVTPMSWVAISVIGLV